MWSCFWRFRGGCNPIGGADTPPEQEATAAPGSEEMVEESETAVSEAEPESAPVDEAETPAGDELDLSSLTEGLGSLSSYKSSFVMRFTGRGRAGQPGGRRVGIARGVHSPARGPADDRRFLRLRDQAAQTGGLEIINIEGTTYMVSVDAEGVRSCSSFSSDDAAAPESGQLFFPDQLAGVSGADYVDSPTVNGVQTKHYRWSEDALGVLGFAAAKGEVWVADPEATR